MADELCPNCGSAGLRGLAFSCGSRPRIGKPGATESVGCLRRQRDALRAERDELRRMLDAVLALEEPVETALRTEIAALKAECAEAWRVHSEVVAELKAKLAKYTEPLTPMQADDISREFNGHGKLVMDMDAAIRAAREGAR